MAAGRILGPDLFGALETCEGRPCYKGIVPGTTTTLTEFHEIAGLVPGRVQLGRSENNTVDAYYLGMNGTFSFPVLGYFIARYGEPCGVEVNSLGSSDSEYDVALLYPTMTIDLDWLDHGRITPQSWVNFLYLADEPTYCQHARTGWLGFRTLDTYLDRARQ